MRKSVFPNGGKSIIHNRKTGKTDRQHSERTFSCKIPFGKSALLALTASRSASGWLILSPVFSMFRRMLDTRLEEYIISVADRLARIYLGALPPAFGIAALLLFIGWLVSFAVNLHRFSAMRISVMQDTVTVKAGYFFPRTELFSLSELSAVCREAGLLGCLMRFTVVRCMLSGFEKGKSGGILLPIMSDGRPNSIAKESLSAKISKRARYKLITLPLFITVCIILSCFYLSLTLPVIKSAAFFVGIITALLFAAKAATAAFEAKLCGMEITDGKFIFVGRSRGRICALSPKIGRYMLTLKRTPFQKKDSTCTVALKIMSGRQRAYRLRQTDFCMAERLLHPAKGAKSAPKRPKTPQTHPKTGNYEQFLNKNTDRSQL